MGRRILSSTFFRLLEAGRPAGPDDELPHHLGMREREFVARGLTPPEAHEAARRTFGNVERVAADCRDIDERRYREERRAGMWNDLRQDVTYGVRLLGRSPGFTAVAVVATALLRDAMWPMLAGIGLGIGAAALWTKVIASFLFNTEPTDTRTVAAVAIVMALAASFAGWNPARRAARLDPVEALRAG